MGTGAAGPTAGCHIHTQSQNGCGIFNTSGCYFAACVRINKRGFWYSLAQSWLIRSLIGARNLAITHPGADSRLSKSYFLALVLFFGTEAPHALATSLLQLEDGVITKHLESWAISVKKTEQSHSPTKIAAELLLFQYLAWQYLDLTCNWLFYSNQLWNNVCVCVGGKKKSSFNVAATPTCNKKGQSWIYLCYQLREVMRHLLITIVYIPLQL